MPLAVSATTLSGRSEPTSTNDTTWSAHAPSRSSSRREPRSGGSGSPSSFSASASMSARPVSRPIGRAPERHNLRPLYCAGLCDAVNMAPGASRCPEAKYKKSVEARPRSVTSDPSARTPSENAAGELDARLAHVAGDQDLAPLRRRRAMARPMARHMSASSWSGTVPRTSYALKTWSIRLTGLHHRGRPPLGPNRHVSGSTRSPPPLAMATMATRLKVAWATMFMPRRPVRYETAARMMPKAARPGQLHPFAVGEAEEEPVGDHGQDDSGGTGAAGRPQRREQPDQRLQQQAAEEELLHGRREHDGGDGDDDEAAAVRGPRSGAATAR